jgi:putative endonuclease
VLTLVPHAVQHGREAPARKRRVLRRRCGAVPNSESVTIPDLQRSIIWSIVAATWTTHRPMMLRCVRDTYSVHTELCYNRAVARSFFIYILTNRRYGVLYVGVTNNLARRVTEHRLKIVPGFTAKYGLVKLVYFEEYPSILEARAREHALKRWRRAWKLDLVDKFNPEWRDLAEELAM